jgi:hypothetical protein
MIRARNGLPSRRYSSRKPRILIMDNEFPPLLLCLCKLPARIRAVWQGNYTISSFFKAMALLCSVNGTTIDSLLGKT